MILSFSLLLYFFSTIILPVQEGVIKMFAQPLELPVLIGQYNRVAFFLRTELQLLDLKITKQKHLNPYAAGG